MTSKVAVNEKDVKSFTNSRQSPQRERHPVCQQHPVHLRRTFPTNTLSSKPSHPNKTPPSRRRSSQLNPRLFRQHLPSSGKANAGSNWELGHTICPAKSLHPEPRRNARPSASGPTTPGHAAWRQDEFGQDSTASHCWIVQGQISPRSHRSALPCSGHEKTGIFTGIRG